MPDVRDLLKSLPHHSPVYNSPAWLDDPGHYPRYAELFAELAPRRLLEVGTFLGYSLVAAVWGSPGLTEICFVDDESALAGSNAMAAANVSFAAESLGRHVRVASSSRARCDSCPEDYDVVHIDGDHDYRSVASDLIFAERFDPKFVVGHDYSLPGSGVRAAVEDFCRARGLSHYTLPVTAGVFIIEVNS